MAEDQMSQGHKLLTKLHFDITAAGSVIATRHSHRLHDLISWSKTAAMPFYTVYHVDALTSEQQDALALAITKIHSEKFTTPKIFVNVRFDDISKQVRYVGGKRRAANMIEGNVRHGPSRTAAHYEDLIKQITAAWQKIVPSSVMNRVVLNGSIVAGMEAGFMLPAAGGDGKWIQDNFEAFKSRADAGDEEMQDIVADLTERGLVHDGKTAMQRLEEALGWGDAA